jgi:RND family efflux transporter MFP subunit
MKYAISRLVPLGLVYVFLPLGCESSTAANPEEVHLASVKAVAPRSLILGEWVELLGSTQPLPNHSARVCAAIEGRVLALARRGNGEPVTEGSEVKAGDVILQLDDRIIRANLARAKAVLLDLAEQKQQAAIALKTAAITAKSKEELHAQPPNPLASALEVEMARLALDDARSKQRGIDAKEIATREDLNVLDEQLRLYTLSAPISGRLGLLQVMPGQVLSVGTLVAEIVDLSAIDVLCYVPPHVAAQLAEGQPARIVSDESSPGDATGKVVFINVQAQADTGNFAVKVRFPNPGMTIRANVVVRLEVQIQPEKERLTIPASALLDDQTPPGVIALVGLETKSEEGKKDEKVGKAKRLQATIGVRDRRWHVIEILSLTAGEKKEPFPLQDALIITEGGQGLQDDDPVKLEEEEEEEK